MIKENEPLVSIVVITYNSAQYVVETLESAKKQSYNNIELIVSDDCSLDSTVSICRDWIESNKLHFVKTTLITSEINTGIPANCNRGLYATQGVWMKIIAGDDTLLPSCIEENLKYVACNPKANVLLSRVNMYNVVIDESNRITNEQIEIPTWFFNERIAAEEQYQLLLKGDPIAITPSLFIKVVTLKSLNGYDELYRHIEDYPLWLKLTKAGVKLDFLDQATVNYRRNPTAIHNTTQKYFIRPAYFKNEEMRKVYVYPNLPLHHYIYQKYCYLWALFFKLLNGNKYSRYSTKLYAIITFRFNPIKFIQKK